MRIRKNSNLFYPAKLQSKIGLMISILTLFMLSACDSSSSSDTDESGYLKFYNASNNAPTIYLEVDEESLTQVEFANSSALYPLESQNYSLSLSWKEGTNDYTQFYEQEISVTDEDVELVVVAGDFNDPEILTYKYLDEEEELDDDEGEENFTLRFINLFSNDVNIDLYMSRDDQTFNEATLVDSLSYQDMSESKYFEVESYVFYITSQGSSEVVYESESINFFYSTQYIMVARDNTGPSGSPVTLDKISKNSAAIEYPDKDSRAELRIYNGLKQHSLLENFEDSIDINIQGLNGQHTINTLSKGSFSEVVELAAGDYSLDLLSSENQLDVASNHFVSLSTNQDKTIFVYLTEEREDADDSDTEDEISIYVNTLPISNSHRVSLYDHQVKVINFVQDDDEHFSLLDVNFVRSNETVETAEYDLSVSHANPKTILLPNNTYDVSVIAKIDDSNLLLVFDQLTLDSSSGDLFMLIEEDMTTSSGYSIKFQPQDSD